MSRKFYDALEQRSKRLAHLVEISAPPQLISNEILLVMQAAMGYCPEETTKAFTNWLSALALRDVGRCRSCQAALPPIEYQCSTCRETTEHDETIKIETDY